MLTHVSPVLNLLMAVPKSVSVFALNTVSNIEVNSIQ